MWSGSRTSSAWRTCTTTPRWTWCTTSTSPCRAKELYQLDVDYLLDNGEVKIVDEFTGRVLEGRRYSEGLHQAIEAKEGVAIKEENQTLATITLQNYFRLYDKLSGMTGTAKTEAAEFAQIYGLEVVEVPTHRSTVRLDQPDLVYKTEDAKFDAVVSDIVERHERGQPVLAGDGLHREVGAALPAAPEAGDTPRGPQRQAARHVRRRSSPRPVGRGAVTVATNMAGRGVDIMLGRQPEGLAKTELKREGIDPSDPSYEERLHASTNRISVEIEPAHDEDRRRWAASTSSGPSGTRAGGSTTSCAAVPGARAIPGSRASTSRWAMT